MLLSGWVAFCGLLGVCFDVRDINVILCVLRALFNIMQHERNTVDTVLHGGGVV